MNAIVIDAHQHFWDPDRGDYGWLNGPFQPLRRSFTPIDLAPSIRDCGIDGTVLVQTWHSLAESWEYLAIAAATPFVAGVVAWVDLTDPAVGKVLAALRSSPHGQWLVGVRHLLHEEPDPDWLLQETVRRGLGAVAEAGLAYDLVGKTHHLPAMLKTVAAFPKLRFVLDHIAKPEIASGSLEPWRERMRQFRPHRDHVWCKLSGMITEADWSRWTFEDLQPYVDEALAIFGADRCMFGSDWPVCLVAGSYQAVSDALSHCLSNRTDDERAQIFGACAVEAYHLSEFGKWPLHPA
jgi:L-fuconolactonase